MGYLQSKIAAPEECDEVFQMAWFKFHHSRASYNGKFPVLNWLFVIARSSMLDHFRKKARAARKAGGELTPELIDDVSFQEWVNRNDEVPEAQVVLFDDISPEQRQAVEMRVVQEMEYEEIARALGISAVNSRQLVSRGLKALKRKWRNQHEIA